MATALKQGEILKDQSAPTVKQSKTSDRDWQHWQQQAWYHYEKSVATNTTCEMTVVHRGFAKEYANKLRNHPGSKVVALNLLGRIALDEGFYALAAEYLSEALAINDSDPGCWYSLGHVRLAQKKYEHALAAFRRAVEIAPDETRAEIAIAYTQAQQGKVVEAFEAYRLLYKSHPDDRALRAKLFKILPFIKADYYHRELEQETLEWLKLSEVDHHALASLVMTLLKHKYQLEVQMSEVSLQDIAGDELLNLALGKLYFTDPCLETFLKTIRKQLLLNCIANQCQDGELLKLACNLAKHADHNEHLYSHDQQEDRVIETLRILITEVANSSSSALPAIAHFIVLYSMYRPATCLLDQTTTKDLCWPSYAATTLQQTLAQNTHQDLIAHPLPRLATIADATSQRVKQQYEENPYPRWLHLGYNTATNYGRALEQEFIDFRAPEFFNMGTIKVLIAGAGTGRHALRVARFFRNVDVLAIDLSENSLAYARNQAEKFGIRNIRFLCADILQLHQLAEQFHIIECSGVLHHMQDPAAGLAQLTERLHHRGLIKIGLYSRKARLVIRKLRAFIKSFGLTGTPDDIRSLRQLIIENKLPYNDQGLLKSDDFYSLSGCRDLMFHVQEHQYSPREIAQLLAKEKLDFKGFVLPQSVKTDYKIKYPDDPLMTNLDYWEEQETTNTDIFAGMFQFYAQKNS